MNRLLPYLKPVLGVVVLVVFVTAAYFTRDRWLPLLGHHGTGAEETSEDSSDSSANESETSAVDAKIVLTDQAIANLRLVAKPARVQTYWKTIQVPGMIVDRPGQSDRDVVSPIAGVVTHVNYLPGDTVRPGDVLFTIRILSESLHQTQSDLRKAAEDIKLAEQTRTRLVNGGAGIPKVRIIEVDNQIKRLKVAVNAYQQELLNRGLTQEQIDGIPAGDFVRQIDVLVPEAMANVPLMPPVVSQTGGEQAILSSATYEVEQCDVKIGQQVPVGQTLCTLANHQLLAIEGRAFRDETLLLERTVQQGWPVEVDFQENAAADWPPVEQTFAIQRIANTIDSVTRTFGFLIPLENQSRVVKTDDMAQILWRFRPGQRLRILVRVERVDDVFVLPADAVTRELAEAFVFVQNVNTFLRKPVRIVAEDRQHTVVANDGSLLPGSFVVQNAADQLDRMTKSNSNDGLPEGYHMHADGSLHKNEDEGK